MKRAEIGGRPEIHVVAWCAESELEAGARDRVIEHLAQRYQHIGRRTLQRVLSDCHRSVIDFRVELTTFRLVPSDARLSSRQ